jgi:hypothetical protein
MVHDDNHDWNALVSTFLLDQDPSRVMDFYQIFDQIPQGVNKWNGVSEGARLVRSSIDADPSLSKRMAGFQQKSLWSEILCYLGATPSTNSCHISFLDIPRCFIGIATNNPLLIIDSGALVCITPHRSDFISYQKKQHEDQGFIFLQYCGWQRLATMENCRHCW